MQSDTQFDYIINCKYIHVRFNSINDHVLPYYSAVLNAASRRKLPAWIREGLEKMEGEKSREEAQKLREQELARLVAAKHALRDKKVDSSKFVCERTPY